MRKQFFRVAPAAEMQHARDQEQMLFVSITRLWANGQGPEYQCFSRVEVNVPISAADPCGGHRERSHQAAAESGGVPGCALSASMNTTVRQASRDAEPGMREKYYVAGRDVHCVSFRATPDVMSGHEARRGQPLNAVPRAYRYRPACAFTQVQYRPR